MGIRSQCEVDARFFCRGGKGLGIAFMGDVGKVKSESDVARVGVNATPVKVGWCTDVLLNDRENPVLVGSLLFFWLFNGFSPLRGEGVKGKSFSIKYALLLHEQLRGTVYELGNGQARIQSARGDTSQGAQIA